MISLDRQLADYSRAVLGSVDPVTVEEALLERTDGTTPAVRPISSPAPVRERPGWQVAVVAAAVTILLGGIVWWVGFSDGGTADVVEPGPRTTETVTTVVEGFPSRTNTPLGMIEWDRVDDPEIDWVGMPSPVDWDGRIIGVAQVREVNESYPSWPTSRSLLIEIEGTTWRPLAEPPGTLDHLAVHGDQLLAVGFHSVWMTKDLTEWVRVEIEPIEETDTWIEGVVVGAAGVLLYQDHPGRIWALDGDRFVAVDDPNLRIQAPPEIAQAFPDPAGTPIRQSIGPVWTTENGFAARISGWGEPGHTVASDDGLTWEPITDPGSPALAAVYGGPGNYLAFTEYSLASPSMVMGSDDGLTWTAIAETEPSMWWAEEIFPFGSGWIAMSVGYGGTDTWLSADGIYWEPLFEQLTETWRRSVSVVDDTILVVDSLGQIRVGRLSD
jgi:hypothetical protein